jgi:pyrroloquinoline quinone biosynthesis protein E
MLRRDLDELVAAARAAGLYSTLVTAGTRFTLERAAQLKAAGLDHVQVSIQSPDPGENDRIAGIRSFEKKIAAARAARELAFPLTINCVLTARTSTGSRRSSRSPRSSALSAWSSRTRSTTGGRS